MVINTIAVFVGGYLLGTLSSLFFMRRGFLWGSQKLYEEKENLAPGGVRAEFEQAFTEDEE